ncbi:MAG: hypothetical protein ACHP6H_04100, partial [Legionellales bacterium]
KKNNYFYFRSLQADTMRTIIEQINYEIPSEEQIVDIRRQFEALKDSTLARIYSVASKDVKILERMASQDMKVFRRG